MLATVIQILLQARLWWDFDILYHWFLVFLLVLGIWPQASGKCSTTLGAWPGFEHNDSSQLGPVMPCSWGLCDF
jgi:hypothetical protein